MPVFVELWLFHIIMLFWETGCYKCCPEFI